jgi:hypothetical protein
MSRRAWLFTLLIIAAAAVTLLALGRNPLCTCGSIDLWVGARDSPKTSQMLADWYSLSHVVHGLLFYAALWLVVRRWSIPLRCWKSRGCSLRRLASWSSESRSLWRCCLD